MKGLKLDVADLFLVFVLFEIVLHYLIPIKQIISYPYNCIGILLFIIGWIPNIWIYLTYKKFKNKTPTKETPNILITSGLFKISRNPNYLGMVIALLGAAIFLGSIISLIVPVLFMILVYIFNIRFEEKVLEKKFRKKYLNYKNLVRRWI